MPGSFIGELIIQPILELVLQAAGYLTARVLVPVLTLGAVVVEPLGSRKRVYPKIRWPALSGKQPRVLDGEVASLLGLVFWGLVAIAVYFAKN